MMTLDFSHHFPGGSGGPGGSCGSGLVLWVGSGLVIAGPLNDDPT